MGISRAEQSLEIGASPEACFDAIVDFETYPQWQDAVRRTEVIERYPDGLGQVVELEVDAKVRVVTYRLRYHYDRPGRLWWDFVEGEGVAYIDGEYLFEPTGDGTLATYRLGIDAGVPIPGFIAKRLNEGVMKRAVSDLKDEAERRSAARR
jgi:ribosome-associated toxin RatA of RatAB toxin-antitoxin module